MIDREKITIETPVAGWIAVHLEVGGHNFLDSDALEDDIFNTAGWYADKFGAYCDDSNVLVLNEEMTGNMEYCNFASLQDARDFAACVEEATDHMVWLDFIEVSVDGIIER